jgi:hypothetical protein
MACKLVLASPIGLCDKGSSINGGNARHTGDKTMSATQKARDAADAAQAQARAKWCNPAYSPAEQRAACREAEGAERQWENASRI